ncbi:MAG: DUF2905 domain-containing protein [Cytophagales bacterium]|nr:DUF2905 domain-containing protein [Cytophagales bacterium]
MNQNVGKYLIIGGLGIFLVGILIYFFWNKLTWLGRLPGDIRIEKGQTKIYFPVVTMIVVSLVLNLLIYLAKRLF